MSDLTIVELTDSLISKPDSILEESNKRKLSTDVNDLEDSVNTGKKICRDTESFDDSSLIVETTIAESLHDDSQIIEEDNLDANILDSKLNDEAETSYEDRDSSTLLLEEESSAHHNINKTEEISIYDEGSSEEDDDDDENYDNAVMLKAINALPKPAQSTENDEPIALDDSESECSETIEELNDEQAEEDDSLLSLHKRMMRYNPKFYFARRLVKKSIKVLMRRTNLKNGKQSIIKKYGNDESSIQIKNIGERKDFQEDPQQQKCVENLDVDTEVNRKGDQQKMEAEKEEAVKDEEKKHDENSKNIASSFDSNKKSNHAGSVDKKGDPESKIDVENKKIECSDLENTNVVEVNSLLNEISCSSVDEIISRYIIRNSEHNSTIPVDDFSEQLFYCLQENKKEIENLQRIWNEKVHLKFKMREIMERLRRQRVISEIETFGIKPSQDNQQSNLLSSKSSTTNSTENEHYERSSKLSSQSVNRLIQDVRENVLKKEKHRMEDILPNMNENFEECSSFGLNSNMFQSSLNQGRQGQIIDVQSIINDFRQKNPQEIPRRGRRMKSSFPNNYFMSNQIQTQYSKADDKINHATLDHNSVKSNSSVGFPEVSLLPVNSYYKTHSPQYGQKSSLLQSILTKQPNKNPLATQPNNKSSTLARLLTAPEKSFQSPSRSILQQSSKVHNNGEITITPIAGTSRRHVIDDEENSEPPLIIDESDDFDLSDRHNANASDLLCQGCRRNKALFMCAGCSRQWYCSKECQELAWDDHAESCMV